MRKLPENCKSKAIIVCFVVYVNWVFIDDRKKQLLRHSCTCADIKIAPLILLRIRGAFFLISLPGAMSAKVLVRARDFCGRIAFFHLNV